MKNLSHKVGRYPTSKTFKGRTDYRLLRKAAANNNSPFRRIARKAPFGRAGRQLARVSRLGRMARIATPLGFALFVGEYLLDEIMPNRGNTLAGIKIPPEYVWCTGPNECPDTRIYNTGFFFHSGGNCTTSGGCLDGQSGIGHNTMTYNQQTANLVRLYTAIIGGNGVLRAKIYGAINKVAGATGMVGTGHLFTQQTLHTGDVLNDVPFGPIVQPIPRPFVNAGPRPMNDIRNPYDSDGGYSAPGDVPQWGQPHVDIGSLSFNNPTIPEPVTNNDGSSKRPTDEISFRSRPDRKPRWQLKKRDKKQKPEDDKERKGVARSRMAKLFVQAAYLTEIDDLIDIVHDIGLKPWDQALDDWETNDLGEYYERANRARPHFKMRAIYRNFDRLDLDAVVKAVIENQIQDAIVGNLSGRAGQSLRDNGVTSSRVPGFDLGGVTAEQLQERFKKTGSYLTPDDGIDMLNSWWQDRRQNVKRKQKGS